MNKLRLKDIQRIIASLGESINDPVMMVHPDSFAMAAIKDNDLPYTMSAGVRVYEIEDIIKVIKES